MPEIKIPSVQEIAASAEALARNDNSASGERVLALQLCWLASHIHNVTKKLEALDAQIVAVLKLAEPYLSQITAPAASTVAPDVAPAPTSAPAPGNGDVQAPVAAPAETTPPMPDISLLKRGKREHKPEGGVA